MAVLERRWKIDAEEAREHAGKWVAIKDGKVRFAADDPADVLAWVRSPEGVEPDLMTYLPKADDPKAWVM
jgi:hypothetical protein